MMGSEIRPIEITDAATTPVVAASSAPTKITASARPPRMGPNSCPMVSSRSSAIPLRSNMSPMSVKNGMASKVSFCMMPKMRSGTACSRASGSTFNSMPMKAKNSPQAPRLKATGKPTSKKQMSPANMMGARLWVRNSMVCVSAWWGRSVGLGLVLAVALGGFGQVADGFGQFFFSCFFNLLDRGVFDQALEETQALDEFGDALQPQQGKTQRHHQVHGPANQPASVVRHFARREGAGEEGNAIPEHGQAHGREEDDVAEYVDPDLGALGAACSQRPAGTTRQTGTTGFPENRWS